MPILLIDVYRRCNNIIVSPTRIKREGDSIIFGREINSITPFSNEQINGHSKLLSSLKHIIPPRTSVFYNGNETIDMLCIVKHDFVY